MTKTAGVKVLKAHAADPAETLAIFRRVRDEIRDWLAGFIRERS